MRPFPSLTLAAALTASLTLALHPAGAQMLPNASRPATGPGATGPGPAPTAALPTAPAPFPNTEDSGGLCQCLSRGLTTTKISQPYENNVLGLRCLTAVEDCKSLCQTESNFSFVPHAQFSCRGQPGETTAKVAFNTRR
jgi:hypothetical protein